jgi:hypothetical protein
MQRTVNTTIKEEVCSHIIIVGQRMFSRDYISSPIVNQKSVDVREREREREWSES